MRHLGSGAGGLRAWDVFPGVPGALASSQNEKEEKSGRDKGTEQENT